MELGVADLGMKGEFRECPWVIMVLLYLIKKSLDCLISIADGCYHCPFVCRD